MASIIGGDVIPADSYWKTQRVLVVGGAGFIGQHLVNRLQAEGADVTVLSLHSHHDNKAIRSVCADVSDKKQLFQALSGQSFTCVFNLGGYIDHRSFLAGGRQLFDTHYTGVLNLVERLFMPELNAFVQVGSSDEYGNSPAPQRESDREAPISPYSAAKTAATHCIQSLARTDHFPGVVLRFFLVYGPGQNNKRFLPQVIRGCLDDRVFPVSAGEQQRDFCYIDDVVRALLLAATTQQAQGHVINIASGQPVAIKTVLSKVNHLIGKGQPQWGALAYREGENMSLYADISLAKTLLGWMPRVSLEEGLQKTIDWYEQQHIQEEV